MKTAADTASMSYAPSVAFKSALVVGVTVIVAPSIKGSDTAAYPEMTPTGNVPRLVAMEFRWRSLLGPKATILQSGPITPDSVSVLAPQQRSQPHLPGPQD